MNEDLSLLSLTGQTGELKWKVYRSNGQLGYENVMISVTQVHISNLLLFSGLIAILTRAVSCRSHERHQTSWWSSFTQEGVLHKFCSSGPLGMVPHQHTVQETLQTWWHLVTMHREVSQLIHRIWTHCLEQLQSQHYLHQNAVWNERQAQGWAAADRSQHKRGFNTKGHLFFFLWNVMPVSDSLKSFLMPITFFKRISCL